MMAHVGPVRVRKLLETFGEPQRILQANQSQLERVDSLPRNTIAALLNWENELDLTKELDRVREFGASVITQDDPIYSPLLREIYDPPLVLYVWGKLEERDHNALGIVGSRRTTHYGLESAKKLSYQIAYSGISVVSGLARGIDTAAHQGALAAKGRTMAVLGTGLNHLYPVENRALAERIAESGAVITEFPMDTTPDRQTFPMRNRIISGWGFGLLVVEAGLNSGALISASQAIDQGRNLYAVPGPIDRPTSLGTNRLIQQGGKLVISVDDILEDLQTLFPKQPELTTSRPPELEGDLLKIYEAIDTSETPIDRIIDGSGLAASVVSSGLLQLEMRRLVKQLPGKLFVKLL
jgi:DNA processing protein